MQSRVDVERQLAGALRRIDVKQHAALAAQRARRRRTSWTTPVSLFTCISETSSVSARSAASTCAGSTMPSAPGLEVRDLEAFALQLAAGVEHRGMLGARGDDVPAALAVEARRAEQREVVGLGGARGEDHLRRIGAHQRGHLRARLLDASARAPRRAHGRRPTGWRSARRARHSSIASTTRGSTGVVAA